MSGVQQGNFVIEGAWSTNQARPTTATVVPVTLQSGQSLVIPAGTLTATNSRKTIQVRMSAGIQFLSGAERCIVKLQTTSGVDLITWGISNKGVNYPSAVNSCLELSGWIRAAGGTDASLNLQAHSEYRLNGYWVDQQNSNIRPIMLGFETYPTGINNTVDLPLQFVVYWDGQADNTAATASGNRFIFGIAGSFMGRTMTASILSTNNSQRTSFLVESGFGNINGLADNGPVVVAVSSTGRIARSLDGGMAWKVVYYGTNQFNDVNWNPTLNLFCAVGLNGLIMTSPTGDFWTTQTSGTTANLSAVVSNSTYGFVVSQNSGTVQYFSSVNGTTWVANTARGAYCGGVALNGSVIVLGGGSGSLYVYDGTTWSTKTAGAANFLRGVYSPTRSMFVFGNSTGGVYYSSDNGATWTAGTSNTTSMINKIADNAGVLLASGNGDYIAWSTDGITFNKLQNVGANSWYGDWVRLEY